MFFKQCQVPGCNNLTYAEETKNLRFSKMYCKDHVKGIEIECSVCHNKYISRLSDYLPILKANKPIICRKCSVTKLNKSDAMRKQAAELGKKTGKINIKIAHIKAHSKEAAVKREKTKRDNGFYDNNGGYYKALQTRKENGSFDKWKQAGQTSHAHALQNMSRWKNMSDEQREKEIERLKRISEFDREKFYSKRLQLICFKNINKNISLNDIDSLKGVPGVWAKFTEDGICLDVAQTKDIGNEMLFSIRAFEENKNKEDNELKQDRSLSIRKKYRDMYKDSNGKIIFKLISINVEDKLTREAIEAQYAHSNKAKYWSPAFGQNI